jgi:hypothetical protein
MTHTGNAQTPTVPRINNENYYHANIPPPTNIRGVPSSLVFKINSASPQKSRVTPVFDLTKQVDLPEPEKKKNIPKMPKGWNCQTCWEFIFDEDGKQKTCRPQIGRRTNNLNSHHFNCPHEVKIEDPSELEHTQEECPTCYASGHMKKLRR